MSFWHTLLVSSCFGFGWTFSEWYRPWERAHKNRTTIRVVRDVALAFLLAPPAVAIAVALASNTNMLEGML